MMKNILLVSAILYSSMAYAGQVTVPNTFTAGTKAKATEVNANFTVIEQAVNDNDVKITRNTTDAYTNTTMIGTLNSEVSGQASSIQGNTTSISTLSADTYSNTAAIVTLNSQVSGQTTSIQGNTTSISTLSADTYSNTAAIGTLNSQVSGQASSIQGNITSISTLSADTYSNTAAIGTLNSQVSGQASSIQGNTTSISTLSSDTYSNTAVIGTLNGQVSGQVSSIQNNAAAILGNASNIISNQIAITAVQVSIPASTQVVDAYGNAVVIPPSTYQVVDSYGTVLGDLIGSDIATTTFISPQGYISKVEQNPLSYEGLVFGAGVMGGLVNLRYSTPDCTGTVLPTLAYFMPGTVFQNRAFNRNGTFVDSQVYVPLNAVLVTQNLGSMLEFPGFCMANVWPIPSSYPFLPNDPLITGIPNSIGFPVRIQKK